jgi:hypothetical protein
LVGPGFELRALLLWSRHSTAWAKPPVCFALVILEKSSHELFVQASLKPWPLSPQPPKKPGLQVPTTGATPSLPNSNGRYCILFLCVIDILVWEMSGDLWYSSFCSQFTSLNMIFSSSIHFDTNEGIPFFWWLNNIPLHIQYNILYIMHMLLWIVLQ